MSISQSSTPKAQTSVRPSTGLPRACSGDMYAAVPMIMPTAEAGRASVGAFDMDAERGSSLESSLQALARPKSRTFTFPSGVIITLPGLRSRWTIPLRCASSRATATWVAI